MAKFDKAVTLAAALLRLARQKAGLTQGDLAERSGVSQQAISAYETGRKDPSLSTLERLLRGAGLEMRIHLEPLDTHDDVLNDYLANLPASARSEIDETQRERVERDRLKAVRR